jgi:K+-transporting ATPase KdpF subunit
MERARAGLDVRGGRRRVLRTDVRVRSVLRPSVGTLARERALREEGAMLENVLGGIVSLGVLVYLLWALLEPERF